MKDRFQFDESIRMDLKEIQREGRSHRSDVNTVMHLVFPKRWGMSSPPRSLTKDSCTVLFAE
jgi:hypothetical protein